MESNKLIVIIKGTYESNSPLPWNYPRKPPGDSTSLPDPDNSFVQDSSVKHVTSTGKDIYPTLFMLDVAELVLIENNGKKHRFSEERQSTAMSLNDAHPFFNGAGVFLNNDDVPGKSYSYIAIVARKMLFDNAMRFTPQQSDWSSAPFWDVFTESAVPGFNFNQFQPHSFYDNLRLDGYLLNRVFPILVYIHDITNLGLTFNKDFPVTVLEIRFVIKNFIKKYEYETNNGGVLSYVHYYALSDWLQDVQDGETNIGGNLLAVARSYVPGLTGSIRVTNNSGRNAHIIAIPAGDCINKYTVQYKDFAASTTAQDVFLAHNNIRNAHPCNIPKAPGVYMEQEIVAELDYLLKLEKYKIDWNKFYPGPWPTRQNPITTLPNPARCGTFDIYQARWDEFSKRAVNFSIPQLAVYVPYTGDPARDTVTIENVSPGSYDLYIANVEPAYGQLYCCGQFTRYGNTHPDPSSPLNSSLPTKNPVTVSPGGAGVDTEGNNTIVFSDIAAGSACCTAPQFTTYTCSTPPCPDPTSCGTTCITQPNCPVKE